MYKGILVAQHQSSQTWIWMVGIPMLGTAVAVYYSYGPRFFQRIVENFLYWVNYALPSWVNSALGL